MAWAPSSYLRDEIVQLLAASMTPSDGEPISDYMRGHNEATISASMHSLNRHLKWTYGKPLFTIDGVSDYQEVRERFELAASGIQATWDGWDFSWSERVDSMVRFIEDRLSLDLSAHLPSQV